MTAVRAVVCGLALLLLPGVALAHSPIKGLDNFYVGLLHPLFVPAHALAVFSFGILLGQQQVHRVQSVALAFLLGLLAGLAGSLWWSAAWLEPGLLSMAVVVGLLVALAREYAVTAIAVGAVLLGAMIGLDSQQSDLSGRGWFAAMLGTVIGVYLLLLYAMMFAEFFSKRVWQQIGLRVLGSWAAASALLVLSLTLIQR